MCGGSGPIEGYSKVNITLYSNFYNIISPMTGYGPSETTNICTIRSSVTRDDLINNIGPPFSNTSAFVLEPDTEIFLPRGSVGELCFGGAQVFRGYQNMPQLNAQKIIQHPDYGRIYRSGDMGRLLPDDSILFTGRSDDQVKIRGQRVELGEITSTILDCPGVEDCVTFLLQFHDRAQRLVSFWVPADCVRTAFGLLPPDEHSHTLTKAYDTVNARLPSYMIPTHLVPITQMPLTVQSKVDKRLLLSEYKKLSGQYLDSVASNTTTGRDTSELTALERKIAEALAEITETPLADITRSSSFASLGLDSISAIHFFHKLKKIGFIDLSVSKILRHPTVALLSSICVQSQETASFQAPQLDVAQLIPPPVTSYLRSKFDQLGVQVQKMLPCTPLQEAMLSNTSSSADSHYHNIMTFRVAGDVERLKACWSQMLWRHDILRTVFIPTEFSGFAFVQVILASDESEIVWDELDMDEDMEDYSHRTFSSLQQLNKPPIRLATRQNETATELVFSCHHAMYDGVAIAALIDEIETLYSGVPLPEPVPYERYLQHAFSQDFKAADTFWTDTFTGFEPKFFPDLLSNSQHTTNTSTSFSYTLQVSLTEILKACRENSVSLLPVVQATWAKLLHWYVGENDVCFGNVVSGRTLPEKSLDRLVAPCFNTLPVRVNFDFGKSNLELIRQLHDLNIDCLPFQLTPLRRIQSKVLKEGGHLFDTLVIFQQPRSTLNQSIWSLEEDIGAMNFPLVCEVSQDKVMDKMNLTLHFNTNIMSKDGAENVAKTFESALQSVLTFPDSPARDTIGLPMKLAAESNTNFRTLNMQDERFLHSAFEENVVLYPDIIALDFFHAEGDRTTWTFKDLNEAANRIAHALSERNVGPEDIVPIHISKSPEFYASILGVLKVGAAFSPLNPDLPKARKDFMLSELCPKVVLCVDSSKLTCTGVLIVDANVTAVYPVTNLTIKGLASTNLAYCLYTSGSTGTPKAVSMEHSGPIHTIESSRNLVPWNHSSRLLQYAAISFDMCYFDCFLAWSFGFTLCAAEQSHMLNNVTGVIQSLATDLLDLTPSVAASLSRASVPSVKWLYCIGEAMSPHIIQEWEGACVNSYGPTEAAFCTTICSAQSDTKPNVIGKPFPSTSFAVYPLSGERVLPVFSIGELCIGGAQLARGYFGRHDLTRDKFVHKSGHRFYKSGDMVRMLGDGNFEFIGRADDQVKIRGLRVELGEINHVIQASDKSISAVTTQIMRKDVDSKDQLVAFLETRIRLDKSEQISVRKSITQTAKIGLPVYMVPQFFIFIDKIPKSLAGKVDKKALKEIFSASEAVAPYSERELGVDDVHEWTEIESCIRGVLAALSKTPEDEIQATTSIYQLGLDSISAVQVASGLRKSGINVNAVDVLKHPNCIDLAAYVQFTTPFEVSSASSFDFDTFDKRHRLDVCGKYGIKSENIEMIRPCTPLQEGMISQFLAKDGAVYFNYLRLQLDKDVDLLRLKEAWLIAMTTHCMLRTGFVHVDDSKVSFAMVHYTQQGFPLPWVELLDDTNLQSTENWIDQSKYYAVSHLQQPSWRVRIIREQQRLALDLAIFHGLFDAQSLRIIFNDVSAGYHKLPIGIPTPIEPLLSTILVETTVEDTKRRAFWENLGKNATSTRFPNLASLRYEPASPVVLTRDCTQALSDLEAGCRSLNVTLQAAGIASWASLLSAYTGETLVTCGVVLSGRTFEAAHSAAFPCITTVPFVCEVDNKKKEMFGKIMTLNADMQQHQLTPLAEAQRLMGFPNEAFFDTIFAYQKQRNEQSSQDVWTIVDERATVEYPVSIELEPKGNVLEFRLTFLPHMVPQEQAVLILNQLDHLLQEFIFEGSTTSRTAKTDQAIYSITPAKEPNLPSEVTLLHEFVEFSARRSPSSIALDFATSISDKKYTSNIWSYAELDSEGNKIANLLISHGARPGELIGVCFDKCPEASFAILGILKAGCAFVALDPGAPSARRAFIIEDSGSTIVLSMTPQSSDLPGRLKAKVLNLDELDLQSTSTTKPMLQRPIDPHDRSYCLYTSGTTGTPKGCELTHENAVQALLAFQRLFAGHWNADSRWLQFASFHFDVSVLEQYWSWSVGICVVSARRDLILEDLAQTIRVLNVTHIDLTPSLARILHPDDVPSLCKGVFITGGESLRQDILDVWGPKSVIYNGYGPTEATIGVTMYPRVPANGKPSNIGPQFDNVGSFVLKAGSDDPILRGGVGELCVSGKLVGKGYLNRPDLTTERFPYLDRFRKRVYRTGDLVRILHDGSFDFLGRIDDQVKLRGQRLEIGEINSVIKQSSTTILDVATLVLKHPKQQKDQLVSFVVIKFHAKSEPTIILQARKELEEARHGCQDKLPGYMIPTHFIALSSLPLTANNKADGRRLKDMYYALSAGDLQLLSNFANKEDGVWSEEERKIQTVLKEVLRTDNDNISKAASFFELGLDSISIIGFARALKEAGFHNAAASLVMKSPSIGRLAKSLQESGHDSIGRGSIVAAQQAITAFQHRYLTTVAKQLDIDSKEIEALAPCTPLQQGMIARSLESEQGLYYNAFYCRLGTELDEHRLRTAWEKAFVAIPVLRTVFVNTEDGFVQVVLRNPALSWIDHKESNHEQLDERLAGLKSEWWHNNREAPRKPFELHFVATPERKMFAVHTFHALYDGLSIGIVFKTVWAIYNGQTPDIGPPFHTALAYGPLQHVEGAQEFWQEHTATDPFKPFTLLAAVSNEGSVTVTRTLENLSAYEATRRSLNVTHQAIAQACWATVLSRYMKSAVSLGIIVSGRSIDFDGADRVIGPMFNTLPYQHRLQKQESWTSIVKKTHEFNVAVHPYQHTPLRDIMKWTKRNSSQPLFETLFVYQIAKVEADWVKNDIWEVEDSDAEADYPLALEVEQKGDDHLKLTLVAQGHVADNAVLNQLLDDFGKALMEMLSDPETVAEAPFVEKGSQQFIKTEEKTAVIVDEASGFEWEGDAQVIRYEIAGLAGVTIEDIKETTPIFELGLDSIDAIKLSSKLKKRGLDLPVSSIMRSLTIANMVQNMARNSPKEKQVSSEFTLVSHKQRLGDYLRHHEANPEDIEQVLPLTPLQEGMVAEMIASDYTRYYNHDILKLAPVIDVERLKRAWTTVVEQSPILRTSFIEVDDATIDFSFAQIIHRYSPEFMRYKKVDNEPDFSEIIESIRESALQKAHTAVPFHLHFIDAPDQRYVILSIAHGLYDGWSLGLLHYDVQRAYEDMFEPQPSYEPALQQILTGSGSDAAAFWGDFLANAKASTFARTDSTQSSVVHRRERSSLLDLTEITSFAKKSNITLEALGQMVYSLVLASTLRSLDIAFGAVLSGRDNDNMSNILFPTMNTVAVRTIIHGSRSEMLRYMQDNLAQIKQWQHFPLRKAQALAGVQSGLFESIFIYQKRMDDVSSTGSNLYESVQGHSDVEYPVCVEMEIVSGELIWRCAVKEEVFDDPGARELLDTLDAVLRAIITEPDAPTITFMPAGTSICGLAAFTDKDQARNHTEPANKETSSQKFGHSVTAKAIREVLAMVSQTPEEEITEGMTIFHIGLDSISAIKVSALLRKRSIALGVGEMLKAGTVKKMVQIVDERTPVAAEKEEDVRDMLQHAIEHIDRVSLLQQASLVEADVEDVLPATAGQIYMLSMWLNSNGAMFYPVFEFDVKGKIALEKLQHAWQALVVTNPILRTCLLATKDIRTPYVQAILNKPDARVIDVIGLEEQDMLDVIRDHAAKQPYAHLFISSSPHGWHLRLKIHHALYDGVSLPLLINQLKNLCNDVEAVSPPSPGLQFAFRQLIATSTSQSAVQQRRAFWTHYLRDINDQHLLPQPSAPPTRKTEVFKSGLLSDIGGIEVFARKNGVTTQALFFAVYAKLYASLTRTLATKDVVLGVYLANRSHPIPDIAQAAIPTVNLVPLRITAPLGKELVDVARQVQDGISQISGLVNAGVSLHEVAEWTGVRVDTLVNFLKLPGEVAGDGVMEQERGVSIVAREMWESDVSRVSDSTLEQRRFEGSGTLVDAWVNAAYLVSPTRFESVLGENKMRARANFGSFKHAIDVEATIRDGKLDVGVFAPEEMLGLQDAEGLVEEMGRTLGGLMEGA
jgi:amino acid adenylation domain-containing protein